MYVCVWPMPPCGVCLSVCPSVRLSVCPPVRVFCENEWKYLQKVPPWDSHTISIVFLYQTICKYFDGDLPNGESNVSGKNKNRDSRRISGYRIDDWWNAINNSDGEPCMDFTAQTATYQWILFIVDYDDEENTTEQNLVLLLICDAVHNAMTSQQCNTNPYRMVVVHARIHEPLVRSQPKPKIVRSANKPPGSTEYGKPTLDLQVALSASSK